MKEGIFDPTNREEWSLKNQEVIARSFGYCLNKDFIDALQSVIQLAQKSHVTALLGCAAEGIFMAWTPPLVKAPLSENISKYLTPPSTSNASYTQRGNIFHWFSSNAKR